MFRAASVCARWKGSAMFASQGAGAALIAVRRHDRLERMGELALLVKAGAVLARRHQNINSENKCRRL